MLLSNPQVIIVSDDLERFLGAIMYEGTHITGIGGGMYKNENPLVCIVKSFLEDVYNQAQDLEIIYDIIGKLRLYTKNIFNDVMFITYSEMEYIMQFLKKDPRFKLHNNASYTKYPTTIRDLVEKRKKITQKKSYLQRVAHPPEIERFEEFEVVDFLENYDYYEEKSGTKFMEQIEELYKLYKEYNNRFEN